MRKNVIMNVMMVLLILPMVVWAGDNTQIRDDPIYVMAGVLAEICQIFLSIWRIVYVTFEIFALIFIYLMIPVIIIKTIKWGINEIFPVKKGGKQ